MTQSRKAGSVCVNTRWSSAYKKKATSNQQQLHRDREPRREDQTHSKKRKETNKNFLALKMTRGILLLCVMGAFALSIGTALQLTSTEPCKNGRDLGIYCGRGSSGQCPGLSYCDIHPTDKYATCCCEDPAATCSDCTYPVNCKVNPCDVSSCPGVPHAECRPDYCGGCTARYYVGKEEVTERCATIEPCSRKGGTPLNVGCGLAAKQPCPGLSYCDIHPLDIFAVCCCNDPGAFCPNCTRPVNCFVNPCQFASCPVFPEAECRSDYCGGCNARFFVKGKEVTDDCRGCRDPAATCPGCTYPVNCLIDPCRVNSCPNIPKAQCRADYCGGCNARFFLGKFDVTKFCRQHATY